MTKDKINYRILSDPHFDHAMLTTIGDRPKGYEKKIMKSLYRIPKQDILICLGDISIGKDVAIHTKYISKINCKKILVKGNHDTKSDNWYLTHGWDFVCNSLGIIHNKFPLHLTHIPEHKEGCINLHGHWHMYGKNRAERDTGKTQDDKDRILISCEYNHYQAMLLDTILLKHKRIFKL